MGKSKKKNGKSTENEGDVDDKVGEKLKKRVADLMKHQKLRTVRKIANEQDGSKSWGQIARAKVWGSH